MKLQLSQTIALLIFLALSSGMIYFVRERYYKSAAFLVLLMIVAYSTVPMANRQEGGSTFERFKTPIEIPARVTVEKPDFQQERQNALEELRKESNEVRND